MVSSFSVDLEVCNNRLAYNTGVLGFTKSRRSCHECAQSGVVWSWVARITDVSDAIVARPRQRSSRSGLETP